MYLIDNDWICLFLSFLGQPGHQASLVPNETMTGASPSTQENQGLLSKENINLEEQDDPESVDLLTEKHRGNISLWRWIQEEKSYLCQNRGLWDNCRKIFYIAILFMKPHQSKYQVQISKWTNLKIQDPYNNHMVVQSYLFWYVYKICKNNRIS